MDVTSLTDWKRVVSEVENHFGAPVTVLVNNAGIIGPVVPTVDLDDSTNASAPGPSPFRAP
ncbi:NAD(P)-dependent dehydrogenase (short-subunit alcohol dehydrogenase family) [Conyzicola nivalis]|uniref:NAD(P)-dependent dehydrogenase (Short-subunit alcohol dehydrogenase family) n=1 Tax=Conyzicola nivalis TaxID=1477021 RepID=A0ABV2QKJ0_9MICO